MSIPDNKLRMKTQTRKRRGNSRYYLYFVLILIALTGAGTGLYYLLSNLSLLNLRTIEYSGNNCVPDTLIEEVVRPYLGQNLLSLQRGQLVEDLSQYARIKNVKLRRRLLSTLRVRIEERSGCLYARSLEGDLYPIDASGIILEKYSNVYTENLPVVGVLLSNASFRPGKKIASSSLQRVLATHKKITQDAPDFLPNISEYYTIDKTVYIIDARNGMRLIPSSDNLAKQFSRYQFVQDNGNVSRKSILDLRFAEQVVVKAGN